MLRPRNRPLCVPSLPSRPQDSLAEMAARLLTQTTLLSRQPVPEVFNTTSEAAPRSVRPILEQVHVPK